MSDITTIDYGALEIQAMQEFAQENNITLEAVRLIYDTWEPIAAKCDKFFRRAERDAGLEGDSRVK
jgi:hypothetical protein